MGTLFNSETSFLSEMLIQHDKCTLQEQRISQQSAWAGRSHKLGLSGTRQLPVELILTSIPSARDLPFFFPGGI